MNHAIIIIIIIIIIIPVCPLGRICARDQSFSTKTLDAYPNAVNHTTQQESVGTWFK